MDRRICIHGHFYQPPRENPWTEEVETQGSAQPYHDWNERITAECYAPNSAARIFDSQARIVQLVNNYSKISFNFGPTLLTWLEGRDPEVYRAILDADRSSRERFSGHGSALAQPYNHVILPLADRRDKETQITWGIEDFKYRFQREPEGMWLPETAVDIETLGLLAEHGIRFTILSPHQAAQIRPEEAGHPWQPVDPAHLDTRRPYRCPLPDGRSITLFFYHSELSRDVAFRGLLHNGEVFARNLLEAFSGSTREGQIVHIATDGETYGHHHRFGEMALAYCLKLIEESGAARLTNYGEFLEHYPPDTMVRIHERTSWSCPHGVARWEDDCGCGSGTTPDWRQKWRKPLRTALEELRDQAQRLYSEQASRYLKSPWEARNQYIDIVLDRSTENVERRLEEMSSRTLTGSEKVQVLRLLELQRNAQLMFTSCGWFFEEISGLEALQNLLYADRVLHLAGELGDDTPESSFLRRLEETPSNRYENGKAIYEKFIHPERVGLFRVGAQFAAASLFEHLQDSERICCYSASERSLSIHQAGRIKLALGHIRIQSRITRETAKLQFAAIYLGHHHFSCGIRRFKDDADFALMSGNLLAAFEQPSLSHVIREMDRYFGSDQFDLSHLFKDSQRILIEHMLKPVAEQIDTSYQHIFESNYPLMRFLKNLNIPLPRAVSVAVEHILNMKIQRVLSAETPDPEELKILVNESGDWSVRLDMEMVSYVANACMCRLIRAILDDSKNESPLRQAVEIAGILKTFPSRLGLWKAQNAYLSAGNVLFSESFLARPPLAEPDTGTELFRELGRCLGIHTHFTT